MSTINYRKIRAEAFRELEGIDPFNENITAEEMRTALNGYRKLSTYVQRLEENAEKHLSFLGSMSYFELKESLESTREKRALADYLRAERLLWQTMIKFGQMNPEPIAKLVDEAPGKESL